jgi:hypothetical protein
MLNAREAREQLKQVSGEQVKESVSQFAATIEREVQACIKAKMAMTRSIVVPVDIDNHTLDQIRKGYQKLGYRVRVDFSFGYISTNLVRESRRMMSLFW